MGYYGEIALESWMAPARQAPLAISLEVALVATPSFCRSKEGTVQAFSFREDTSCRKTVKPCSIASDISV
jgi:hypothetical protein